MRNFDLHPHGRPAGAQVASSAWHIRQTSSGMHHYSLDKVELGFLSVLGSVAANALQSLDSGPTSVSATFCHWMSKPLGVFHVLFPLSFFLSRFRLITR